MNVFSQGMRAWRGVTAAFAALMLAGTCAAATPEGGAIDSEDVKETNATRAARVAQESFDRPRAQKGGLSQRAFGILWGRGLKEMFAMREDGSIVQIREYGPDTCLRKLDIQDPGAGKETSATDDGTRTLEIIQQIGDGLYTAFFVDDLRARKIVLAHPGPLLADGDRLEGTFERIGAHRHGTSNLAKYVRKADAPTRPIAASSAQTAGPAPTPATIQAVYDAFQKGEISFVLPTPVTMKCLRCDGTGKDFDEVWIQDEAKALYYSNYTRD